MKEQGNRLLALEGIRGVAAIIVVVYHTLLMFYAYSIFGPGTNWAVTQNIRFEDNVYANPLAAFISGSFAVALFFVLSGFVLSIGFFSTGETDVVKKLAAKRYVRLMLPALASVMIAWLILTLGLSHAAQAARITQSGWLESMWTFTPRLFDALSQGTWGIFFTGENYYNPVLWTMTYEFLGSFIVFATLLLAGKLKHRWLVYVGLFIATYNTWYVGFILGMVLADLYQARRFPFAGASSKFMGFLALAGVVLAGYPAGTTSGTFYDTFKLEWLSDYQNHSLYTLIGAFLVIAGVLVFTPTARFFSSRIISGLGKYTYSLYLTHKLVLFTVCAWLFTTFVSRIGIPFNTAVLLSVSLSVPVIMIATVLFEKYIDAPSIRVAGVFSNWLLGLPQKQGPDAYTNKKLPSHRLKRFIAITKKIRIPQSTES